MNTYTCKPDCSAPLCPHDKNVRCSTWYPGQPVCPLRNGVPAWVEAQRSVARVLKGHARDIFLRDACSLTVPLLEELARVRPEIAGIGRVEARTRDRGDS